MTPALTAVILAGGQASRMGGLDKGWVELAGKPLILHVLERIRPQAAEVLISANRRREDYQALGCTVLPDALAGFPGPLAGIQQALRLADREWLLCVPCDMPWLPQDLADRLYRELEKTQAEIAVASAAGSPQPVVFLCRRRVLASLDAYLQQGGRRVGEWQAGLNRVLVEFADAAAFRNLNTPEELVAAGKEA